MKRGAARPVRSAPARRVPTHLRSTIRRLLGGAAGVALALASLPLSSRLAAQGVQLTPHACGEGGPGVEGSGAPERKAPALEGIVVSSDSGRPLPGALVTARPETAEDQAGAGVPVLADPSGVYRLCESPAAGRVTLRAHFAGRAGPPVTLSLEADGTTRQALTVSTEDRRAASGGGGADRRQPSAPRPEGRGRVLGRIADPSTEEPVEGAMLLLEGTEWQAVSDARGAFALNAVRSGLHLLRVQHIAYGTVLWPVDVPAGRTLDVRIELAPDPIELEPLVVTAVRSRRLEHEGFYERRTWGERVGIGHFLTAEQIMQSNPYRVSSVMNSVPGVRVECRGGRDCFVRMAGSQCSHSTLYLDGFEFQLMGEPIDRFVLPHDIAGIEIYRGMGELAAEFADPRSIRCGAVVIWTRGGA